MTGFPLAIDGALKGLKTGLTLLRIMLPVYILVILVKYSPLMPLLTDLFAPAMALLRMPGEAAAPIIAGVFTDEYGCIAAMGGFSFDALTVTTIAMVNLCCHSIPVESAINGRIGFAVWRIVLFRLCLAVFVGFAVSRLGAALPADRPASALYDRFRRPYGLAPRGGAFMSAPWDVILREMGVGCLTTAWSLFRVIVPLMILIEFLLAYKLIERTAAGLGFLSRVLGIGREALLPLLVGLFMGVSYGAGALIEINRRTPLSKRDIALMAIFIYCCHGIIETTFIFSMAGASPLFVGAFRLLLAVLVTTVAARLPWIRRLPNAED
jgi:hypothetical protein